MMMMMMCSDQSLEEGVCQRCFSLQQSVTAPHQTSDCKHCSHPDSPQRPPCWIQRVEKETAVQKSTNQFKMNGVLMYLIEGFHIKSTVTGISKRSACKQQQVI